MMTAIQFLYQYQVILSRTYRCNKARFAVISPETGIREETGVEKTVFKRSIRDGKTVYTISSAGEMSGSSASSIVIDWVEYSKNSRGMNIVIYDNSLMKVVDKVCFNTSGDCVAVR